MLCTLATNTKFQDLTSYAACIISNSIIPLIFGIATVVFIWGVVQYVINANDEEAKTKGRNFMIWGIIGLAVMVSMWGLVNIVGKTFNLNTRFIPQVKQ